MDTDANHLRAASDAIITARRAAEYLANPPPDGRFGVSVEWSWGRNANDVGYFAIKELVVREINRRMDDMVRHAVSELMAIAETKRDLARKALDR